MLGSGRISIGSNTSFSKFNPCVYPIAYPTKKANSINNTVDIKNSLTSVSIFVIV